MTANKNTVAEPIENINAQSQVVIEWGEPTRLKTVQEYGENAYPLHAFPKIVREAIEKVAYYNHVPLALAGQTALGIMVYIAQEHVQAPSDKSKSGQPCSFGLFTVFESGGGKDETRALLGKGVINLEKAAIEKFNESRKASKNSSKLKSEKLDTLNNPQSLFEKSTIQGIVTAIAKSDICSFAWQTTEGAMILGGYSLTSDTMGESLGVINNLIDKGSTSTVLKGIDEPEYIIDKRFSLDLSIQDVMAKKTLKNEVFMQQGFLARFLFAAPHPLSFKEITLQDRLIKADEDEKIIEFYKLCERLKLFNSKINNLAEKGNRFIFEKSEEAHVLHIEFENFINKSCTEGGKYSSIRPYAKRSIQYSLRIAAVLAYFSEDLDEINTTIMQAAIDICIYSLNEWIRYYAKNEKSDSQLLLEWLLKQNSSKILKSSISTNVNPKYLRKKTTRDDAIKHLLDSDCIAIEKIFNKEYVVLNPRLKGLKHS